MQALRDALSGLSKGQNASLLLARYLTQTKKGDEEKDDAQRGRDELFQAARSAVGDGEVQALYVRAFEMRKNALSACSSSRKSFCCSYVSRIMRTCVLLLAHLRDGGAAHRGPWGQQRARDRPDPEPALRGADDPRKLAQGAGGALLFHDVGCGGRAFSFSCSRCQDPSDPSGRGHLRGAFWKGPHDG